MQVAVGRRYEANRSFVQVEALWHFEIEAKLIHLRQIAPGLADERQRTHVGD